MFDLQNRLKAWGPEVLHVLAPDEALDRDRPLDFQLTRMTILGWRATFYATGMEHSATSATGTGWERTAGQAVQWRLYGR